jgi:DNA-binding NarL/FixJ family response regulator
MIGQLQLAGGECLPAHLVLVALADLSAAVEAVRHEMKRHGPAVPATAPVWQAAGEDMRDETARRLVAQLPKRQGQVLSGIVRGCANKVIAWELGLSVRTVEAYRAQLFDRLGARNTADAVRLAIAAGFQARTPLPTA